MVGDFSGTGRAMRINDPAASSLRAALSGELLDKECAGYDEARTIWNAMIDRRPGFIARCKTATDVAHAVDFARDNDLMVAIKGCGHNISGSAVCDDGVVIDLSLMKSIRVDPKAKRLWVEPGATLGEIDRETQVFGLAVPTGINSTTGIAGLTLGGGFGWTSRKLGLTIDSLASADVVIASGEILHCTAAENPELFWALRGGGGNFGVVTQFEFVLHPIGPQVLAGLVVHPLADAEAIISRYREIVDRMPDDLTCWVVLRNAPPLPFLPADWHGKGVLVLAMCWTGDLAEGEEATAELRALGNPIADVVGPTDFDGWQTAFDPLLAPGARNYWKSHDFGALTDEVAGVVLGAARSIPGPECEIFIFHMGGATSRVEQASTAFPQRKAHFGMNIHARWREKAMDDTFIQWATGTFDAASPLAMGTAYVNFMPDDEGERVESAYGQSYRRLQEVKRRYDPSNLFRINQNVRP